MSSSQPSSGLYQVPCLGGPWHEKKIFIANPNTDILVWSSDAAKVNNEAHLGRYVTSRDGSGLTIMLWDGPDTRTPIPPALTAEEWEQVNDPDIFEGLSYEMSYLWGHERPHAAIAIINDSLPDSDQRKITREMVVQLRDSHGAHDAFCAVFNGEYAMPCDCKSGPLFETLLSILESYLPPEEIVL